VPPAAATTLDPTVQRVVDAGKTQEEAKEKEALQKEEELEQKIQLQKQVKARGAAKLKEAAAKKHKQSENNKAKEKEDAEHHKMPADEEFPVGEADKARVAFSNWIRLGRSGETLLTFTEKMAARHYFDFEQKSWHSVIDEFKKIFEAAKPEAPLPDPKEFAERLYGGYSLVGGDYKPSTSFDAAFSLSDESILALETLEKFKQVYRANKAGDFLVAEAQKLDEAQKTSFVSTKLASIVGTCEPLKALRLAIERLGPASEVSKKLSEIDSGKGVNASEFWMELGVSFDATTPGIAQVANAIRAVEARHPRTAGPTAPNDPARDKKDDPPPMMKWAEAQDQFEALERDASVEMLLAELGAPAGGELAANQAALLEKRKQEIESLVASMKSKKAEQTFEAWREKNHAKTVELNRAVAQLASAYANKIAELRHKPPRLDADGVTQAAAAFRRRIGSNTLVWALGELNPADCKPEEKVDAGVALAPFEGGTWNALLDPAWLSGVYEKFDPALFVKDDNSAVPPGKDEANEPDGPKSEVSPDGKPAEKKEAVPSESDDKDATRDQKVGAAEQKDDDNKDDVAGTDKKNELKAADEKLKKALKQCENNLPPTLKVMTPEEKLALSAKPEPEVRKELFADFESLRPLMGDVARELCAQLSQESGLAAGYEGLPAKFAAELYDAFVKGDAAPDFEGLLANVVKTGKGNGDGYLMKGRPIEHKDFDAAVPSERSLSCVIDTAGINESALNLSVVRADFDQELPEAEGNPKELVAFALDKIKRDPVAYINRYCNGPQLVRDPSWLFPEPQIESDVVFSEYCDLRTQYASRPPERYLRMTLKRESVVKKMEDKQLKRPTVFDAMLSRGWLERETRDRSWGASEGGIREALMKVDWEDVDQSKWECVQIDAKHEAVLQAAKKGTQ
jgi:hypothetical protein